MKKSTSFTYDLIRTLSPPEKTYVKKTIGSSSSKYLGLLFDDLCKYDFFQKEKFIEDNRDKPYIDNLCQNKNYLSKKIIEALISYRSKAVLEIEINEKINEALILLEKKFYKRAKKIIDGCLEKALSIEDYLTCCSLIDIIFRTVHTGLYFRLSDCEINRYRTARDLYLTQLNRINKFTGLGNDLICQSNSIEKINAFQTKLKELGLTNKMDLPEDYPFVAKRIFYISKAYCERELGNKCLSISLMGKLIDLYKKDELFLALNFSSFLKDSTMYLGNMNCAHDYDNFFKAQFEILRFIKKIKPIRHHTNNTYIYYIKYLYPQSVLNNSRHFTKSIQLALKHKKFIDSKKNKLSSFYRAISSLEITLAYLYNHEYEQALTHLEPAFDSKDYIIQYGSRILKILIHHTLKDDFLLDSLFQSFTHYLKTVNKKDQIPSINKLKKHIKNNTVHLLKNEDFEDFIYIHWDIFEDKK